MFLLPTAIHQRRHALLHPDQDEWQRERRRERTNPHPRLPQDRSDTALHEPHRQHGTGCLRHVIIILLCWRRGDRQGGAEEEEHRTLITSKKTTKPMAVRFDPSILPAFPTWTKTYCQNGLLKTAPRKWWTENRNFFFFFLVSGCLKNRYRKKEGKRAAIKKSSTGRVFGLFFFFTVFIYVEKKKSFILQCDACAVPFRWSCWR